MTAALMIRIEVFPDQRAVFANFARRQSNRSGSKLSGWPQPDAVGASAYFGGRAFRVELCELQDFALDLQRAVRFRNSPSSAAERAI